ncbi:RHS repeat domain-containing protein [Pseudoalteromonas sp. A601]|uniref:RHS repeat domain-containing protein n=1 Tax=Pseudoalteromonas sp. A601 TaxID=1967839 RepID=UPI0034E9383A
MKSSLKPFAKLSRLIHMNGRVYDYNLGRFMSVDPLIQSPTNSQSINPYSYIMNNPLSGADPTGYCSTDDSLKDCAGGLEEGKTQAITNADGKTVGHVGKDSQGNVHISNGSNKGQAAVAGSMNSMDIKSQSRISQQSPLSEGGSESGSNLPSNYTPDACQTSFNCDGESLYDQYHDNYHEYGQGKGEDGMVESEICSAGLQGCNPTDVGLQSIRNAAPGANGVDPVSNQDPTTLPLGVGTVDHEVDIANNRVINITRLGHIFEHGYVIRSVVERNGKVYIRTYGEGINTNRTKAVLNDFAGRQGFRYLDNRIRQNILSRSPQGRQILFNDKLNNIKVN